MKDIGTFKHGEEGTHWACDEVLLKNGECCGCTGHKCKLNLIRQSEPMKRIKKECKHDEHHATTKDGEHWCPVCREVLFSSPKPTKIKKLREWDFDMTGLAPEATTAIRILGNKINQIIDLLSH